jgi:hypothetical protein
MSDTTLCSIRFVLWPEGGSSIAFANEPGGNEVSLVLKMETDMEFSSRVDTRILRRSFGNHAKTPRKAAEAFVRNLWTLSLQPRKSFEITYTSNRITMVQTFGGDCKLID